MEKTDLASLAILLSRWTFTEKVRLWNRQGEDCLARLKLLRGQLQKPSKWDRFAKARSLTESSANLTHSPVLKPSRNPQETPKLATGLQVHLKRSNMLRDMTLLGIHMTADSWKVLGDGFSQASLLTYVSLIDCGLSDLYMAGLVHGLSHLPDLQRLDLSGNCMETGYEVGRIIVNHAEKRDEVVWAKGLRNEEVQESVKGLEEVVLASNHLTPQAVEVLAHVLTTDVWLKSLDLRWNQLSEAGVTCLIDVLTRNKTLLHVDVRDNGVDESHNALRIVCNLLKRNYARYQKGMKDDCEKWKGKLFSLCSSLEPVLQAPGSHTPSPSHSPRCITVSSPLTDRRAPRKCPKCALLTSHLAAATKEITFLRAENARMSASLITRDQAKSTSERGENSETMTKIEQMMTEVSRLMDSLERDKGEERA